MEKNTVKITFSTTGVIYDFLAEKLKEIKGDYPSTNMTGLLNKILNDARKKHNAESEIKSANSDQ